MMVEPLAEAARATLTNAPPGRSPRPEGVPPIQTHASWPEAEVLYPTMAVPSEEIAFAALGGLERLGRTEAPAASVHWNATMPDPAEPRPTMMAPFPETPRLEELLKPGSLLSA